MKLLKSSLTMRGDSLYCPLSFSLDSYGNCLTDCHHCYLRNLNHVWGTDLKPADLDLLEKKLINGLKNKNPKTPLAYALANKKTIRWGNKTDPFQLAERKYKLAPNIFRILRKLNWSFVIQTKFTHVLRDYDELIMKANKNNLITIMPVMSPGMEKDWEIFERKLTSPPMYRILDAREWMRRGIPVGFNGEPFIPGYHTLRDFKDTLKILRSNGIDRYNTYNFHFNAFVAKRLHEIGVDIEKIWYYNQDAQWKPILAELIQIAKKYDIKLGCPDFVNTGKDYREPANTCCGVEVPNPCTFNSHFFKKLKQDGLSNEEIIKQTYDGTADLDEGASIIEGTHPDLYTLKDAGF